MHHFKIPVVSIGNLSVGGTGKSPHVEYVHELLTPFYNLGIISRGYHRKSSGIQTVETSSPALMVGDEPLQFKLKFSNTPIVVAEKRAEGIRQLLKNNPTVNCLLLDDSMQHWAIKPSVQLLLTTFQEPFFEDYPLPMGRLREFPSGYQRAAIILVSKCPPNINLSQKKYYTLQIAPLPHQQVFFSYFSYNNLYNLVDKDASITLAELKTADVLVVSAIANTSYLHEFMATNTAEVGYLDFPDHHYFTTNDLVRIQQKAGKRIIVTTQKDATKLQAFRDEILHLQLMIYVLPIKVEIAFGEEALFKDCLLKLVGSTIV